MNDEYLKRSLDRFFLQLNNAMEALNDRTLSDGTKLGMIMYALSDMETNMNIVKDMVENPNA